MNATSLRALAVVAAAVLSHAAGAADYPATVPQTRVTLPRAAPDKLGDARKLVAAKQWDAALDELRKVNDTRSADWHNLMGYALRKSSTPDLTASERHYDEALRIDPHHRNALEYSGELYLMKGNLDMALARLATLSNECAAGCEQYTALNSAIERYKVDRTRTDLWTW